MAATTPLQVKISLEKARDTKFTNIFIHEHLFHGKQFQFSLNVLCHLQVGLAVGDIDKIQVNALIDRYVMQVEQTTLR